MTNDHSEDQLIEQTAMDLLESLGWSGALDLIPQVFAERKVKNTWWWFVHGLSQFRVERKNEAKNAKYRR